MIDAPHAVSFFTAADLRAALAHAGVHAYCVAALLRMHPTTLSQILNGHRAFDQALAGRIIEALRLEQCAKQNNAPPECDLRWGITKGANDDDADPT